MKLNDAIKTLDDVIPAPDNKMVDGDHKEIAIAWKEIREYLTNLASKPTGGRLTQRNERGLPRNFCPVCGRQLEEELKDETETL